MQRIIPAIKTILLKIKPINKWNQRRKKRLHQAQLLREARIVPGIPFRVHKYDFMFAGESPEAIEGYNRIGAQACGLIENALALTKRTFEEVDHLLDFGCGYGRVTRVLVEKLEPHKISVFDVDPGAAQFCAQEFFVRPLFFKNKWDFNTVPFGAYDVIWLGSVFTHLSERYTHETFNTIFRILKPNGLLLFTTHGEQTFPRLQDGFYGTRYQALSARIMQEYDHEGFSFIPYEDYEIDVLPFVFERARDFGVTWMSSDFVDQMATSVSHSRLALLKYTPLGWDYHQDVYYYQRGAS